MRLPIQVLVYPARHDENDWKYLLLQRIPDRGGFWQGVTGGVKESESLTTAARRELIEESGFTSFKLLKIDYSYSFPIEDKWRDIYGYEDDIKSIVVHVFMAYVDVRVPKIDPNEHTQWKWCRFNEALELLAFQEDKEALKHCHSAVKKEATHVKDGVVGEVYLSENADK